MNTSNKKYNIDQSINPGDDFYEYVCSNWKKENPLPSAYSRYDVFNKLNEENQKRIQTIFENLEKKEYKKGSIEQKLKDLYALGMDMQHRNEEGEKDILNILKEIESAKDIEDLRKIQNKYCFLNLGVPLSINFDADEKNSSMNVLYLYQGGLTLPDKMYYLSNDESTMNIRKSYRNYIIKMFQLFNFDIETAQKKMELILQYETEIAKISKDKESLRDPIANYNRVSLENFENKYKNIPLVNFLEAKGIKKEIFKDFVIGQPDFCKGIDSLIKNHSTEQMKSYIEWHLIGTFANFLSDEIINVHFEFFGKILQGKKEQHLLTKRVLDQMDSLVGNAIGKLFCEEYFPESSKHQMIKLVENLQIALAERILQQTWMSQSTKIKALGKLSTFRVKIGYPDKWDNYEDLEIDKNKSFFLNILNCFNFLAKKNINKRAGKPVDKDEWLINPHIVNAYYNPTSNEICFPAGILQSPFFDPEANEAQNYGAIGSVIGHEMTHAFDDQGRHYDKDGNLNDWWTEEDSKRFKKKTQMFEKFFSAIEVLPGLYANGKLTLGENIADHGGIKVSFQAYKNATQDKKLTTIDNLTPDQRFFASYAFIWAGNINEETIKFLTNIDPHSLELWRVNGTLPHIEAWYNAFKIKKNDKLFIKKENRANIW